MKTEEKTFLLSGQLMASAGLYLWCFVDGQELLYTTCPQPQRFMKLMQFEDCLPSLMENDSGMTAWYSNTVGMNCLGDSFISEVGPRLNIVVGPFFFQDTTENAVRERLRENNVSLTDMQKITELLPYIPIVDSHLTCTFASILHFTCGHSGVIKGLQSLAKIKPSTTETFSAAEAQDDALSLPEDTDHQSRHISKENAYLSAIRNGDLSFVPHDQDSIAGELADYGIQNNLRTAKNNVIAFTALASRAAVEGGIPWNIARKMEHEYIGKIEKAKQISSVAQIMQTLVQDFSRQVKKVKQAPQISPEIYSVCEYLQQNYMYDIPLEEIAAKFGYEKYYLSRKFAAQMGVNLTDYLRSIRLNHAKLYLASSDLSIEEISYKVCFATRSYFNRCFREEFGLTPQEFRQKVQS